MRTNAKWSNDRPRVLIVHNHYGEHNGEFASGGEGLSVRAEADLLRLNGHEVYLYERTNAEIEHQPLESKLRALVSVPWSADGYRAVSGIIREFKPDLMHVNNYRYLLSPSVFAAARDHNVATVFTLRNYQLICPASQFLRKNRPCEDCLDGFHYRMLWRFCAKKSVFKNLCHYYLYLGVRRRNLLTDLVDVYIALTRFARDKFIAGGLPAERICVKPNSMADPLKNGGQSPATGGTDHYAVCAGRISPEKGCRLLVEAWKHIDFPLIIVGDGPLRRGLEANSPSSITFAGSLRHEETLEVIRNSRFMVFPTECYEGFPRTVLEAMALGKAVIASDLEPRRETVEDGVNGLLFNSGSAWDLRRKVKWMIGHEKECERMGKKNRELYLSGYTPDINYRQLSAIYHKALGMHEITRMPRESKNAETTGPLDFPGEMPLPAPGAQPETSPEWGGGRLLPAVPAPDRSFK